MEYDKKPKSTLIYENAYVSRVERFPDGGFRYICFSALSSDKRTEEKTYTNFMCFLSKNARFSKDLLDSLNTLEKGSIVKRIELTDLAIRGNDRRTDINKAPHNISVLCYIKSIEQ